MAYKSVINIGIIGSIGIGSWYAGSYVERNKASNNNVGHVNPYPALPIFGTVSAASPIMQRQEDSVVSRVGQIMKYGFPGLDNIRSLDDYVLSYDRRNRIAHWVFEHMNKDTVANNPEVDRSKCEFTPDESIHSYFRYAINLTM